MGIANGDEKVDEFGEQSVDLAVVRDAPVGDALLLNELDVLKSEKIGQASPDVTLLDDDVLAVEGRLYTYLSALR